MNVIAQDFFKKIAQELFEKDEIPLFTKSFIDLSLLKKQLQEKIDPALSFTVLNTEWKEKEEMQKGFAPGSESLCFCLEPLTTPLHFMIAKKDIEKIVSFFFGLTGLDSDLIDGFYQYLILKILELIEENCTQNGVSLQLADKNFVQEDGIAVDIEISLKENKTLGRLILPNSFRKEYNRYFASIALPKKLNHFDVGLGLQIGTITIGYEELTNLKAGDFLLPDKLTADPLKEKARAILTFANKPLFYVKISENRIKILDHALYQEEEMEMKDKKIENETNGEEEFSVEKVSLGEEPLIEIKDAPVTLAIELAKISINTEKLMNIKAGNFLELPIPSFEKVSLTMNGKVIAKAELITIGEKPGIRILEI